jgi:hypothetical protein
MIKSRRPLASTIVTIFDVTLFSISRLGKLFEIDDILGEFLPTPPVVPRKIVFANRRNHFCFRAMEFF